MTHRAAEQLALLSHVLKWTLWATIVGGLVGLSTAVFLTLLSGVTHLVAAIPHHLLLLPLGLLLSAWVTKTFAPEAGGQGVERVIQAVHYRSGKIQGPVIPVKALATLCTIGIGGSAGNVGPCAQIGGGLTSLLADLCRVTDGDRQTLVVCGMSAGFASVMGTPLAGAVFGVEVLFIGSLAYQFLLPSVIAAVVGHQVALATGLSFPSLSLAAIPSLPPQDLPFVVVGGIAFGLIALIFIESLNLGTWIFIRLRTPWFVKALLGGTVIIGVALATSPTVLGLGYEIIYQTLHGQNPAWYLFFLKILVTSLTLNFGGSGGVILPICFVGATAGSLFGAVLEGPAPLYAALGFVGVLAGAINAPITAILLAVELFGLSIGPYALIICAISFVISGHRSAIPTQLLHLQKAPALHAPLHQEICRTDSTLDPWVKQYPYLSTLIRRYRKPSRKDGSQGNP